MITLNFSRKGAYFHQLRTWHTLLNSCSSIFGCISLIVFFMCQCFCLVIFLRSVRKIICLSSKMFEAFFFSYWQFGTVSFNFITCYTCKLSHRHIHWSPTYIKNNEHIIWVQLDAFLQRAQPCNHHLDKRN